MRLCQSSFAACSQQALRSTSSWREFLGRSSFSWQYVKCVFKLAAATQFQDISGACRSQIHAAFHGFGQTKLVEDTSRELRLQEIEASCSTKKVPPSKKWAIPVQKQVLSKLHHYEEVTPSQRDWPEGVRKSLPKNVHRPLNAHLTVPRGPASRT